MILFFHKWLFIFWLLTWVRLRLWFENKCLALWKHTLGFSFLYSFRRCGIVSLIGDRVIWNYVTGFWLSIDLIPMWTSREREGIASLGSVLGGLRLIFSSLISPSTWYPSHFFCTFILNFSSPFRVQAYLHFTSQLFSDRLLKIVHD